MKRVMLKLSGEALAGNNDQVRFDNDVIRGIAAQVKELMKNGIEVGIVTGGGNFWRGRNTDEIDRSKADMLGMLATVMNCIYVSEIFRSQGLQTVIYTPFECSNMTIPFSKDAANEAFAQGVVVFFAGGTGHPFFSSDSSAVLNAIEMDTDMVLLAKAIDGVYTADPKQDPNAERLDIVTYDDIIAKRLGVIDMTAASLARDNDMRMRIFMLNEENSIVNATTSDFNGTEVVASY